MSDEDAYIQQRERERERRRREDERLRALIERYRRTERQELQVLIVPTWDLTPNGLLRNFRGTSRPPKSVLRCSADSSFIYRNLRQPEVFDARYLWSHEGSGQDLVGHDEDKIAQIMNEWENGQALTPPYFSVGQGGVIDVADGIHRLSVCFYLEVESLPFYVPASQRTYVGQITTSVIEDENHYN